MSLGGFTDVMLFIGRAYITYTIAAGIIVTFLIWFFTSSLQRGGLEPDAAERTRGVRDKLIRYAARRGLWGSNYSLAEQIEVVDVGLSMIDKEDGDPDIVLILVDKYDTKLELPLHPQGLLQMAAVYQKITSPEAKLQLSKMRETFRSNSQC